MIAPLDLQSEPFLPTGSLAAEGVQNQLGRPRLDRLALLVREAVQNSWDARSGSEAVQFGISCWSVNAAQRTLLRDVIVSAVPPGVDLHQHLSATKDFYVFAVYDRGTVGLGGPTRADVVPAAGERTDFVDFMRNIGQPPDREYGGGTYGFGKTAFYLASHVRTICVHTRCHSGAQLESRFMAAVLGPQYKTGNRRFTGRHWWGRLADDGTVDPLIGADADLLADGLGLPGFEEEGCGTTVLILLPDFEDQGPSEALRSLGTTILHYFWPKMVDGPDGIGTMRFQLILEGKELGLPRPDSVAPLDSFVRVFRNLASQPVPFTDPVAQTRAIASQRPAKDLGFLSLLRFSATPSQPVGDEERSGTQLDNSPLAGSSHHVALMRAPNFVVRYFAGPPVPFNLMEYAGVFRVDPGVDAAFAKAEPPTHDDWIPDVLEDRHEKTYVRVALRKIREVLVEFTALPVPAAAAGENLPLGSFSDMLGGLIPGEEGTGAGVGGPADGGHGGEGGGSGRGGGGRPRRPARLRILEGAHTELVRGVPALVVPFEIEHTGTEAAVVASDIAVVLDGGGIETEPPVGTDRPRVLEWRGPAGIVVEDAPECAINTRSGGRWTVAVSVPSDAMVSVSLRLGRRSPT